MKRVFIFLALAVAAGESSAQTAGNNNPVVSSMRREWQIVSGYITKAAEQMPEADYAFRPIPTVRTFGELIGHLAGAQNLICAWALGETPKAGEDDIEKSVKTKAGLVAAFRASNDNCMRAYTQADGGLGGAIKLFGSDATRLDALVRNTVHDGEHYGNLVTYLRVKGMVPPSSQPRTAP